MAFSSFLLMTMLNNDDFYLAALRALPFPVLIKDDQHRYVFANDLASQYLDPGKAPFLGKTDLEFFPADHVRGYWEIDRLVLQSGQTSENEEIVIGPDGQPQTVITRKSRLEIDGQHYILLTFHDITLLRQIEQQVRHLASHDGLTGLANRSQLYEQLHQFTAWPPERRPDMALLLIDLDGFKHVNDSLGHQAGDALLQAFGQRLGEQAGPEDLVARMGGDEFALLIHGRDEAALNSLCRQILEAAARPFSVMGAHAFVGASIGVSWLEKDEPVVSEMIRRTDLALYEAKHQGKGGYVFYSRALDTSLTYRRQLESELASALAKNAGLRCVYQPLVSSQDRRIVGLEALVRWHSETRGDLGPDQFIPVAESSGLIIRLGEWILRQACRDARDWAIEFLAVNISPVQLRDSCFADRVLAILDQEQFPAGRLELEISEAVLVNASEASLQQLGRLREAGVNLSLDDFGSGYSSLRLLRQLEPHMIKIDRAFIQPAADARISTVIVEGLARLGASLGISVVAKGVEQPEQCSFMVKAGCTGLQGFYFSRPMEAGEIPALLPADPDISQNARVPDS